MKLFDLFGKDGRKIGEIHDVDTDSGGSGCFVGLIAFLIFVVGGFAIWPILLKLMEEDENRVGIIAFLIVVILSDIIITLCCYFFMEHKADGFGQLYRSLICASTIITSIVYWIVWLVLYSEMTFLDAVLIIFMALLVQLIPTLIMAAIIYIFK